MSMGCISPTNRNFVAAYTLLVGLPLLGLAGVLKVGHALSAPTSIEGTWTLDTNGAKLCGQTLQDSALLISQSGRGLVLDLNNGLAATGAGTLIGVSVHATVPLRDTAAAECGTDAAFALSGVIDSKAEPKTMKGAISVQGCSSCSEVSYRAVRLGHSSGRRGH